MDCTQLKAYKWSLICLLLMLSGNLFSQIEIESRQLSMDNFPCLRCHHDLKNEVTSFPLNKPHDGMVFKGHMENMNKCFSCHSKENLNQLRLLTGESISFDDSQKLCMQCHGEKGRDWKRSLHGKQIGKYSGEAYRYTCVGCHNPHSPKFPQYKADPPPHYRGRKNPSN